MQNLLKHLGLDSLPTYGHVVSHAKTRQDKTDKTDNTAKCRYSPASIVAAYPLDACWRPWGRSGTYQNLMSPGELGTLISVLALRQLPTR